MTACAPQTQTTETSEVSEVRPSQTQANTQLLGTTLNVPETPSAVPVDTPFLQGELAPLPGRAGQGHRPTFVARSERGAG